MIAPAKKLQGLVLIAGVLLGKLESKGSGKGFREAENTSGHEGLAASRKFGTSKCSASRNPTIDRGMFLKGSSEARNWNPKSTDV